MALKGSTVAQDAEKKFTFKLQFWDFPVFMIVGTLPLKQKKYPNIFFMTIRSMEIS